jgi:hypothetical protein
MFEFLDHQKNEISIVALVTLLVEKGVITLEEFTQCRDEASEAVIQHYGLDKLSGG